MSQILGRRRRHVSYVFLKPFLLALLVVAWVARAEEPGTVYRGGASVFRAEYIESSPYFVSGTEHIYPPLKRYLVGGENDSQLDLLGIDLLGTNVWDVLAAYTDTGGLQPYSDFASHMQFSVGDERMFWPLITGTEEPISYLGTSSFTELFGGYLSRAHFGLFNNHTDQNLYSSDGFSSHGFPRVGAPEDVRIPFDYPPVSQDIVMSNSVLVPSTVAGTARAIYSSRETLDSQLDLITGQPLLREVDLELPFGGAVFRRIRTYTEDPAVGLQEQNWRDRGSWKRSRTAGWHGAGWMSNDAPLFLIDAGYAQTMTTPTDQSPRCIFALDAHHSIPFVRQVSQAGTQAPNTTNGYVVDYVAPEWFDAILLHSDDGSWDQDRMAWSRYPTEFRVILNKRSVTYVIKPYYEDVDPQEHKTQAVDGGIFSVDDGAGEGGFGVPYYGLVTEVRDRAGNRVEYQYATGHRPFNGPIYEHRAVLADPDSALTDRYQAVLQYGWYKGMIDRISLYPAGQTQPAWTLIYTYRLFASQRNHIVDWNYWDYISYPPALHSILVYKGDQEVDQDRDLILRCHEPPDLSDCSNDPPDGWEVHPDDVVAGPSGNPSGGFGPIPGSGSNSVRVSSSTPPFTELLLNDLANPCTTGFTPVPIDLEYHNQFDYQDKKIGPLGEGDDASGWSSSWTANWSKQVRYSYADPPQYAENGYTLLDDYTAKSAGPVDLDQFTQSTPYSQPEALRTAYLLKVRTIERDSDAPDFEASSGGRERYWLYRYQDTEGPLTNTTPLRFRGIWDNWAEWRIGGESVLPRRLSYRFGPEAVDRLSPASAWQGQFDSRNSYINHLIGMDEDEQVQIMSGSSRAICEMASSCFLRWSEPYRFSGLHDAVAGGLDAVGYAGSWVAFDGQFSASDTTSDFQTDLRRDYLGSVQSEACDLTISQADPARTGFLPEGTAVYSNTDMGGNTRWYRMYRFVTTPQDEMSWRGVDSQSDDIGGHDPESGLPRGPELVLSCSQAPATTQSIYRFPYRFAIAEIDWYDTSGVTGYGQIARSDPMWWVVIDEYESLNDALSVNSSLTHGGGDWCQSFYTSGRDWLSRRVVAMNPTGMVLSDRTWDQPGQADSEPAVLTAFVYDEWMRLKMRLSRGWGSALAHDGNEGDHGLVEVFEYDPVVTTVIDEGEQTEHEEQEVPREVRSAWLNKGCLTPSDAPAQVKLTEINYYRHVYANTPEYLSDQPYSQVVYSLDDGEPLGSTQHRVEYWGPPASGTPEAEDYDAENPPIKWELDAGELFRREPGGDDLHPVRLAFYNRRGQLVWRLHGSMRDILDETYAPGTGLGYNEDVLFDVSPSDELFLDYFQYDEEGRQYIGVEDIDIGVNYAAGEDAEGFNRDDMEFPPSGGPQQWPIDEDEPHGVLFLGSQGADIAPDKLSDHMSEFWTALDADIALLHSLHRQALAPALDQITYTEYSRFGPSKVVHPSGARDLYDYRLESDYLTELSAMGIDFDGESWGFSGQQLYNNSFNGGQFVEQIQSAMDDLLANQWDGDPYNLSSDIFREYRLQLLATVTPSYDSSGRLSSMSVTDPESQAEAIEQFVAYDGWGNITRSQDAEGLINHVTYDRFGRKHKTFQGSRDRHEIWGTADIGEDNDDMMLVEKLHYGLGANDAGEISERWSFREKSPTQYGVDWDEPSEGDPSGFFVAGGSGPEETSSGSHEQYFYDWRMRRVATLSSGLDATNSSVFREQRLYLDNADRVRFTAIYNGPANSAAPDPDIGPGQEVPPPSAFFQNGAASNLLSLEETVYNGAGQTVETRRYDPESLDQSQPGFLVTQNYSDDANRPTWSRDSGQRITKQVYDAKGRMAWSSLWAGGVELTRTLNVYGPTGTIDAMITIERIDTEGAPSISLDDANKRITVVYQWFDANKRLISRADFGEEEYAGTVESYFDPNTGVGQLPERPLDPPVVLLDQPLPNLPDPDPDLPPPPVQSPSRKLVGVEYPTDWIGADGRGTAHLSAYWYGATGRQNAALRMLSATRDSAGDTHLAYTIARSDCNSYGQELLTHRYGYEVTIPVGGALAAADCESAAEFIGGMSYGYEYEGWHDPADPDPAPVWASTKVRSISPVTEGQVIVYNPESRRNEVDWTLATEPRRTTELEYNAPVVEPGFVLPTGLLQPAPTAPHFYPISSNTWAGIGVSRRPDLVRAVHFPSPTTGEPDDGTGFSYFYFYTADGMPAVRLDSRGMVLYYTYDERGNLVRIEGDDSKLPLADTLGMEPEQLPSNTIRYAYDAIDRLVLVTTGRSDEFADGSLFRADTESLIEYDAMGNMLTEYQSREGLVDTGGTRHVDYLWERVYAQPDYDNGYAARDNINRLARMTYPARTGTHDGTPSNPREIVLHYGDPGSVSDLLSRVEEVTTEEGPSGLDIGRVADYQYSGVGRLESVMLGHPAAGSPGVGDHILRDERQFDLFGRVASRAVSAWNDDESQTYRDAQVSQFGYDLGNRRIFERLTQQQTSAGASRDNTHSAFYDYDLQGRLVSEGYGTLKTDPFAGLDTEVSGRREQLYGLDLLNRRVGISSAPGIKVLLDGLTDSQQTHVIDERGGLTGLDDGTTVTTLGQDASGGITTLDGRDIYHDWLGRPVLALDSSSGDPVFSVEYDGFGRVAQRRAPWPDNNPDLTKQRIETYYYDGVRRVQEVFSDPVGAIPPWPVEVPVGGLGGGGTGSGDTLRTEAEYIWSAANGQPFDTCHVQIDWWDREAWLIQDHSTGTLRAFVDANGEMVRQYRFDAFGNLLGQDAFPLASGGGLFEGFRMRIGHQGLFAERVDGDTTATVLSPNPSASIWYQNRSRWYVPQLGRFMTPDPNATGVPTVPSLAMLGRMPVGPPSGSFDALGHYGDGWDVFTAYGADPVTGQDPSGLSSDPFDEIDAIIDLHQITGILGVNRAKSKVGSGLKSINAYTHLAIAWDQMVMDRDGGILMSMVMSPFFSTTCFERSTPVLTASGQQAIGETRLGDRVFSRPDPARVFQDDGPVHFIIDDSWFVVKLLAQSDRGDREIKLLRPRSWALSNALEVGSSFKLGVSDRGGEQDARVDSIERYRGSVVVSYGDVVTAVYRSRVDQLVEIRLDGPGSQSLRVTPEHPLWSVSRLGWVPAGQLRVGDTLLARGDEPLKILAITTSPGPADVVNLEVAGNHTYLVGEGGVLAHNSCTLPKGLRFGARRGGQSAGSAAYQSRITGLADDVAVYAKNIEFDGFIRNMLIDAKGPGYEGIMASRSISASVAEKMAAQARRQLAAAGRYDVVWVFAEEEAAKMARYFFGKNGIKIIVKYVP